jgi:hypothetical protein
LLFVAAQEFGLANVTAIQVGAGPADFPHGANFAIISSTANNASFFARKGLDITPFSLDTQMFWFRTHLQQLTQQLNGEYAMHGRPSPSATRVVDTPADALHVTG